MNQDKVIGNNIRQFREGLNLSQSQFAEYLGVTREEVSYYENGHRTIPSKLISKAATLFCVDEYDLFEQDPALQNSCYILFSSSFFFKREKSGQQHHANLLRIASDLDSI